MAAPASLFRAFADPTRLRLLALLAEGETCVGDLVGILGLPQPTVSRHLRYLRQAGLVTARKEGLWHFYRLTKPRGGLHGRLVECLDSCMRDLPEIKGDRVRAARMKKEGGCCPR